MSKNVVNGSGADRGADDENINIYLMNSKAPCFIKDDKNKYTYLILPVNFNTVG